MAKKARPEDYSSFLRIRGDTAVVALQEMRGRLAKDLEILDAIIAQILSIDEHIEIAGQDHKKNLISLMRQVNPKTQGLSDEQVMAMFGKAAEVKGGQDE